MKIGELSAHTGVSTRLLRYYEEVHLLHPTRSGNGYRDYDETAIARVQQIRELIDAGLTTEMVGQVLLCYETRQSNAGHRPAAKDLDAARGQLARIERRIEALERNRLAVIAYLDAWDLFPVAGEQCADNSEVDQLPDAPGYSVGEHLVVGGALVPR